MQNSRIETVLIIISLGALLFVLGSVFQAVLPAGAQAGLAPGTLAATQAVSIAPLADGPTSTPVRPANCVAIPLVPTPGPGTPTATPAAITHRFDLAPNLDPDQKSMVLVLRCDGTWDQYWLAPAQVFDPQKELKAGDVVFSVNPPGSTSATQAPLATQAPTRAGASSPAPTARSLTPGTPGALTRTPTRTSTQAGYPAQATLASPTGYPAP